MLWSELCVIDELIHDSEQKTVLVAFSVIEQKRFIFPNMYVYVYTVAVKIIQLQLQIMFIVTMCKLSALCSEQIEQKQLK